MAVSLEIDDGDPWWLSPDLWTVPGTDPNGPPGTPIVGQPAYIWARVHNRGSDPVDNATVRFWWANPGTNFDRNTATMVGISYVSLVAGASEEVLCLTPWDPAFVNGGHECIIGEAFHPALDPLPPGPAFNVVSDRHVAQRNLDVIVSHTGRVVLPFEVHNRGGIDAVYTVSIEQGDHNSLERIAATLGRRIQFPLHPARVTTLGLSRQPCPEPDEETKTRTELVKIGPRQRVGFTLVAQVLGGAALFHVTQSIDNKVVGGLSVLAIGERRES
jgi:hypothetical protein